MASLCSFSDISHFNSVVTVGCNQIKDLSCRLVHHKIVGNGRLSPGLCPCVNLATMRKKINVSAKQKHIKFNRGN